MQFQLARMRGSSNSAKLRLRLLTSSLADQPILLPVYGLSDSALAKQHLDAELISSQGQACSQIGHSERSSSAATETWLHQGAGPSGSILHMLGSIARNTHPQYHAPHEKQFSTSSVAGNSSINGDGNSLFAERRLMHLGTGASNHLLRAHWYIRKFKRFHMGHSHHHHDHIPRDDSGDAGERVTRWGLFADVGLAAGKGFVGYISGSTAVIADAAHSISDVVLSGTALWFLKVARAPKDERHPYGHGKFETLGALGISSMLLLTGGGIAWHAVEVLQASISSTDAASFSSVVHAAADQVSSFGHEHGNGHGHGHSHVGHHHGIDMEHQAAALSATVISIGVKEGLYWVTKKVGDARGSELLKANAWHHRSDAISSVIALLGVGGAMLGLPFLDPLAGLLVSGMVIRAGLRTGYQSLQELVDSAVPESVLSPIKETVMKVKGVEGCHQLRGRRAGSSIHLDVHIEVDPWLSVSAAHIIGETTRRQLQRDHPSLAEIFIHIDSADAQSTCSMQNDNVNNDFLDKAGGGEEARMDSSLQQEVEKTIRQLVQSEFSEVMDFGRVRCHFLQGKLFVEVEVSMNPDLVIRDAMQYASDAERKILEALPQVSSVNMQLRLSSHLQVYKAVPSAFSSQKGMWEATNPMFSKNISHV